MSNKIINLHAHTNYSDGRHSIEEMAVATRDVGHCALVVTDHDTLLDRAKYDRARAEAAAVSAKMSFPIFMHLELDVGLEHVLMFGTSACQAWLKQFSAVTDPIQPRQDKFRRRLNALLKIKRQHTCALILAHPRMWVGTSPILYALLDGYEVVNHKNNLSAEQLTKAQRAMPSKKTFKGIDAHSIDHVYQYGRKVHNQIGFIPQTEQDLIDWIATA